MMAGSTCKIIVLLVWIVLVREVLTQDQTLPDTATPEEQNMVLGSNQESENDAIEMGRNAAEDMGALMVSPPMKMYRPPLTSNESVLNEDSSSEYSSYANAREAEVSPCQRYNNAQRYSYSVQPSARLWDSPQDAQWYLINSEQPSGQFGGSLQESQWYSNSGQPSARLADSPQDAQSYPNSEQPSGRSAVPRTIPLAPLPTHPFISGVSPLPMLFPLIQSLTNPGRLGLGFGPRPHLRTPLPFTMPALRAPFTIPALRTPFTMPDALRSSSQTYQLPKMNRVWIPPSLRRARSSFTPSNYARNPNQYKPLVFYV